MHEADEVAAARFRLVEAVDPFTGELRGWAVRDSWGLHDEATGWLQYLGDQDYSRNTIKSYGRRVTGFLNWCDLAGVDWRDLSHDLVGKWKRALIDSPYRSGWTWKRRSPKTVDLWLVATIEFYKYAASRGHVPADLVAGLLVRKFVRAGAYGNEHGRTVIARAPEARMPGADADGPVEWIESEGQRAALRSLPLNSRDRYLVDLLDSTGVRFGEALGLHRADQHFLRDNTEHRCRTKGPHVHVRRRTGLDNGALAKDRSGRWIPVPVDVVHSWYAYSDERVQVLGADANPLVFVNLWGPEGSRGAAVSQDTLRRELFGRKISKALGEPIHPHMLRHTRATIWANGLDGEAKRDLMVVQQLLGHRSLASTQVYLHSAQTRMRQSVEAAGLRRTGIEETA